MNLGETDFTPDYSKCAKKERFIHGYAMKSQRMDSGISLVRLTFLVSKMMDNKVTKSM